LIGLPWIAPRQEIIPDINEQDIEVPLTTFFLLFPLLSTDTVSISSPGINIHLLSKLYVIVFFKSQDQHLEFIP